MAKKLRIYVDTSVFYGCFDLAQEFAGMSEEEMQRQMNERINAVPILGPFLKQIQAISCTDKPCRSAIPCRLL